MNAKGIESGKNLPYLLDINLLAINIDGLDLNITISLVAVAIILIVIGIVWWIFFRKVRNRQAGTITINMPFNTGTVEITANYQEKLIAHQIWTELVTRKAALPFEREKDVIVQVYDSWYTLFGVVRELIRDIPVEKLHGVDKGSIEHLTDVALNVLNDGLRPHLTEWQAKFRAWYDEQDKTGITPQELQQKYGQYEELVTDIESVN